MTGPQQGEFWVVEFRGEVTIAQPIADGARWQFVGDMKGHEPDKTFRAIRKLDLGALIDREDVAKDRLIWLLIEAAGGKINIGLRALQNFDPQRSTIEQHTEVGNGGIVFRSLLKDEGR